jgi:2-polyprenyl-3-methyl-5-hydroxy-6-metoxy-1,4-benzoquinol methylase
MARRQRETKPFQERLYEEIPAGYYDQVYRRGRGSQWYWHEQRFRTVERLLPNPCGRLLDLGCGPGTFLGTLRLPFGAALGIDLAAAQIHYARRSYGRPQLDFRHADVRNLPVEDSFQAVVSIEVIEHLPRAETQPFLRTIFELLEPGGTVVLTTPNYRSLWRLIEPLWSTIGPVDYRPQHINHFTRQRLLVELTSAGFCNVQTETLFVVAPFLAGASRHLADLALRFERARLPSWGVELVARAEKPPALDAPPARSAGIA